MSKITKRDNPRIIIEPEVWKHGDFESKIRVCKQIVEDVKRHIDNIGYINIEYDTNIVCSYCGYGWDVDENGEPLCCQAAIDEFTRLNKEPNDKPSVATEVPSSNADGKQK